MTATRGQGDVWHEALDAASLCFCVREAQVPCSSAAPAVHHMSFPPHGWSAPDGLPLLLRKQHLGCLPPPPPLQVFGIADTLDMAQLWALPTAVCLHKIRVHWSGSTYQRAYSPFMIHANCGLVGTPGEPHEPTSEIREALQSQGQLLVASE